MSNVVTIYCTKVQEGRVNERLEELQKAASPGVTIEQYEALDDLIHHGFMLLQLPSDEIQVAVTRANERLEEKRNA